MAVIVAIGDPQVFAQTKRELEEANKPAFLKLQNAILNAKDDSSRETWEKIGADFQKIGETQVMPESFEKMGKFCQYIDIKQKIVASAIKVCVERFNEGHFKGDRLEKTQLRIGGIYLLAEKTNAEAKNSVRAAFSEVLQKFGVEIPGYLKVVPEEVETPELAAIRRPDLEGKTFPECVKILKDLGYTSTGKPTHKREENGDVVIVSSTYLFSRRDPQNGRRLAQEVVAVDNRSKAERAQERARTESAVLSNRSARISAMPKKGSGGQSKKSK